jgi:hypothetical protein
MTPLENAEVYTSDGKSTKDVRANVEYFTSCKVCFVLNEENRIPLDAILYIVITSKASVTQSHVLHGILYFQAMNHCVG